MVKNDSFKAFKAFKALEAFLDEMVENGEAMQMVKNASFFTICSMYHFPAFAGKW